MSEQDSPGRGVTVTLKEPQSKQYANDGTWIIFHGTPEEIRRDLIAVYGIEVEGEPTLYDLATQAKSIQEASRAAGKTLGARSTSSEAPTGDVWDKAQKGSPEKEPEPELTEAEKILALISDQTSVEDVRKLYTRNEELIKNDETLLNAWKAKGRELSEKAAAAA